MKSHGSVENDQRNVALPRFEVESEVTGRVQRAFVLVPALLLDPIDHVRHALAADGKPLAFATAVDSIMPPGRISARRTSPRTCRRWP